MYITVKQRWHSFCSRPVSMFNDGFPSVVSRRGYPLRSGKCESPPFLRSVLFLMTVRQRWHSFHRGPLSMCNGVFICQNPAVGI